MAVQWTDGVLGARYGSTEHMRRTMPADHVPGIYVITNLVTGKRYVGQAQDIGLRIRKHQERRNLAKNTNRLYRSVKRYGWPNFDWQIVEQTDGVITLDARERYWIALLRTTEKDCGYNLHAGATGERGWHHSDATRQTLSKLAAQRTGERNPFYGRSHSEVFRDRQRERFIGTPLSDAVKAKLKAKRAISGGGRPVRAILQIDPRTGVVRHCWPSISAASTALNLAVPNLIACCKGWRGRKTAGGWQWQYAQEAS